MRSVFLFPGYGSQFVGMGKDLYDHHRVMQEYFEEASHCLDINFVKLCFASSDVELGKMEHAYPSLFLVSCSLFALIKDAGIVPDAVAGYNQGEYAALYAAGAISFPDGLYLLVKYTTFFEAMLQEVDIAAMRVSGLEARKLEALCKKVSTKSAQVFIALYQTPTEQTVIGNVAAIDLLRKKLIELDGVVFDDAANEIGLHSPLADSVVSQFKMYLEKVDFKTITIPFISSRDGEDITDGPEIKEQVTKHWQEPVRWPLVMDALEEYDLIVEVGPGTMLSTWAHARYPEKKVMSINNQSDIDDLKKLLGK
jgi:[acyl-carrier-protein] S-malonyltransferase